MANMFEYGFWGWEYEVETKELLYEASRAIRTYLDVLHRDGATGRE